MNSSVVCTVLVTGVLRVEDYSSDEQFCCLYCVGDMCALCRRMQSR